MITSPKPSSPSLNVKFAGVEFRSPIGLSAVGSISGKNVTPEEVAGVLLKLTDMGAGFLYVHGAYTSEQTEKKLLEIAKDIRLPEPPASRRAMRIETKGVRFGLEGMFGAGAGLDNARKMRKRWPESQELVEILRKKRPQNVPLIANVGGLGGLPDSYVDAARAFEEVGVDLVELNLGSPRAAQMAGSVEWYYNQQFPPANMGGLLGDNPDIVEKITREVVKAVKIPVGIKITPETGFPRVIELARRIKGAGASYIHAVNLSTSIAPPNIYDRGKTTWPFADSNPLVSASGPWLRQILYKDVALITKLVPGIDIAAAGGLSSPENCVEVLMLGARLSQLCTAVLLKGMVLIRQCDQFLRKFMAEQGYRTVDEIIGRAQEQVCYGEDTDFSAGKVIATLDEAKCTKCELCLTTLCAVIHPDNGRPRIDTERCTGCGRCIIMCPKDALRYSLKK